MASRYYSHSATRDVDMADPSNPEEPYAMGEDALTSRDANDRLLTRAIEYIAQEGGDDSPATFIDRVERIDDALVKQLPQQGLDFNTKLYRRVRAMVEEVQHEFDTTAAGQESAMVGVDAESSGSGSPSPVRALYRGDESGDTEDDSPMQIASLKRSRSPLLRGADDNVERERTFRYGGPNNQAESWHKDFPAILPFPETLQMAHWESLKIDFDISERGKKLKADGEVVETNIPFSHRALGQYKNLHQFDSGSRFKLPKVDQKDRYDIVRLGSVKKVGHAVDAFNRGDTVHAIVKDYAPRVFLDKLHVGKQVSPTVIREAVNTTPTKSRQPHVTGANMGLTAETATSALKKTFSSTASKITGRIGTIDPEFLESISGKSPGHSHSPGLPRKTVKSPVVRPRPTVAIPSTSNSRITVNASPASGSRPTAAIRRIQHEVDAALLASPRRKNWPDDSPEGPNRARSIKSVDLTPTKRGRGRPRKSTPVSATVPAPEPTPAPTPQAAVRPRASALSKRKHSLSAGDYTPDGKRRKSLGSEEYAPFTKTLRSTPTASPRKRVGFAGVDSDDDLLGELEREHRVRVVVPVAVKTKKVTTKKTVVSKAGKQIAKKQAGRLEAGVR